MSIYPKFLLKVFREYILVMHVILQNNSNVQKLNPFEERLKMILIMESIKATRACYANVLLFSRKFYILETAVAVKRKWLMWCLDVSDMYFGPWQTSTVKIFCENILRLRFPKSSIVGTWQDLKYTSESWIHSLLHPNMMKWIWLN